MSNIVPFQNIQFSVSKQFSCICSSGSTYQVLPLQARVDLEAIAIKGYLEFPKTPALLEPQHQIV